MLYTKEHQEQQQALHDTGSYGVGGNPKGNYGKIVNSLMKVYRCRDILDYGCGSKLAFKGEIKNRDYTPYDIIPPYNTEPSPHDMVVSIDVLEHIEPECIDDVLDHIRALTMKCLFASIHTAPALKTLPDGRNAHLIQEKIGWWVPKIERRYTIQQVMRVSNMEFFVIATP